MAPTNRQIQNVVVLGSTGNVGIEVVKALSNPLAQFTVTAVTRDKSKQKFPANVRIAASDLSTGSLRSLFKGQDAVVNCLGTSAIDQQKSIVDVAVESGIVRFIPSEYGLDSTHSNAAEYVPVTKKKIEQLNYIRQFEDKMSWSTLIVGSFFDWQLYTPGAFGFNVAERRVTIFDGGDVEFETTSLPQIGAAVATILSPEHQEKTSNQVIFVNSFTTTQNQIVAALEKATGDKMSVEHDTTAGLRKRALSALEKDPTNFGPVGKLITASVYGQGGINLYSRNVGGLWNDRLGLEKEDFQQSIAKALAV